MMVVVGDDDDMMVIITKKTMIMKLTNVLGNIQTNPPPFGTFDNSVANKKLHSSSSVLCTVGMHYVEAVF